MFDFNIVFFISIFVAPLAPLLATQSTVLSMKLTASLLIKVRFRVVPVALFPSIIILSAPLNSITAGTPVKPFVFVAVIVTVFPMLGLMVSVFVALVPVN